MFKGHVLQGEVKERNVLYHYEGQADRKTTRVQRDASNLSPNTRGLNLS